MPFNLSQTPTTKPSGFTDVELADGLHNVAIEKVEYAVSSNGNPMLKLRFKSIPEGKFIFDQIMDDQTNQINIYKLSKLLLALNLRPEGVIELKDMTKFIRVGAKLIVATVTKASADGKTKFVNIDTNKFDGYYPMEAKTTPVAASVPAADPQPELKAADNDDMY